MRIYLAGKIRSGCWRHSIVNGLRGFASNSGATLRSYLRERMVPCLHNSILGVHDYVGPFFISCDHSGFHGENTHGVAATEGDSACACENTDGLGPESVLRLSLASIASADLLFAWIEAPSCYGTLVELGFAAAHRKPILIAGPKHLPDLWFAYQLASLADFSFNDAKSAFQQLLSRYLRSPKSL